MTSYVVFALAVGYVVVELATDTVVSTWDTMDQAHDAVLALHQQAREEADRGWWATRADYEEATFNPQGDRRDWNPH